MEGPRKLKGKLRVCSQPEAPALQSSVPSYWKLQGLIKVIRSQLGTSQMLLHKPKVALPTLVGYSPISPTGRMHSSPIMISAPYILWKTMQEHSGAGRTFLLKGGFGSWCPSRLLPPFSLDIRADFLEQRWLTSQMYVQRSECFSQPVGRGRKCHKVFLPLPGVGQTSAL